MTLSDWTNIIGAIVTVASVAFGLWQQRSRVRYERFVRAQNWFLYEKANQASGYTQAGLRAYMATSQEPREGGLNPAVIHFLSLADAFGQDVVRDVARQMQLIEPRFDAETVSRWVREGRVNADAGHGKIFATLTPADQPIRDETLIRKRTAAVSQDDGSPPPDHMRSTPQGVSQPGPDRDRRA